MTERVTILNKNRSQEGTSENSTEILQMLKNLHQDRKNREIMEMRR